MQLVMLGQKRVNMKLTMVVVNTKVNMKQRVNMKLTMVVNSKVNMKQRVKT